jgi:hypothetical protein
MLHNRGDDGGYGCTTVGLNLFSSWLYDRLKSHLTIREIRINRRITEVTSEGIRRAIEESIVAKEVAMY